MLSEHSPIRQPDIKSSFHRYVATATTFNERFVKDWCEKLRKHAEIYPDHFHDIRGESIENAHEWGFTIEGAISKYVWSYAAEDRRPPVVLEQPPDPSNAEREGRVYRRRPESVIELYLPVALPPPSDEDIENHRRLVSDLLEATARRRNDVPSTIPMPEEYFRLLSLTQRIYAPGADGPSWWSVFFAYLPKPLEPYPGWRTLETLAEEFEEDIAVMWCINSRDQNNFAWLAYCRVASHDWKWTVLEESHGDVGKYYSCLAAYLDNLADRFENVMNDHYEWEGEFAECTCNHN